MSVPVLNRLMVGFLVPKDADAALKVFGMLGSSEGVISKQPKILGEVICEFSRLPSYKDCWRTLIEAVLTPFGAKAQYQFTEDSLKQIHMPALFIWGDNDPFGGLDVAHKVGEIMPNVQLRELSAGHLPYIDQPETCGRLIREFLNS